MSGCCCCHSLILARLNMYKNILSVSPDRKRVKFTDSQSFHFLEDRSAGPLSEKIKVLNFPVYVSHDQGMGARME